MSAKIVKQKEEKNSGLLKELHSIPVVESAASFVENARKQSRVVRTGLAILEFSFSPVLSRFTLGSRLFASIDSVAEKGIISLKEKYPSVTQSPEKLQDTAYSKVRKTVRAVMSTPPGRLMIAGLDWAIQRSTGTLKRLNKTKQTANSGKNMAKVNTDHAYASEDSGAFEPEVKGKMKEPQSALLSLTEEDTVRSRIYKLGIIYPLEKLVSILRYIRWYLGGSKRTEKRSQGGGETSKHVSKRTIKSPRKRLQVTMWTRMKQAALRLFGLGSNSRILGVLFSGASNEPLSPGNAERKRPHDEILTDETSESDGDDIRDFDFDNYDSNEDPDYEPQEMDSGEESVETSEGVSESDFEDVMQEALTEGCKKEDCRDVRKKRNEASTTQGIKMAQASKDIKSTVASDKGSSAESKKATQDSKIPTPDSKKTKEQSSAVTQEAKNIQQENRKPSTETSYSPKDVVKVKGTGKNVGSPDSKKAQAGKTEQKGKEGPPKPDAKNPAVLSQDTGLDTQQKKDASKSSAPRV